MRTKINFQAVALSIKETEGSEGRKFYQVSIDQDGEAGTLPLTEEAYHVISGSFKKYSPSVFTGEYNDQYKSLRITGIQQGRI